MKNIDSDQRDEFFNLLKDYLDMRDKHYQEIVSQENRWLRTSEASAYLSISQSQLHSLKAEGVISCSKLGGTNFYDRRELDKILEENKIQI